MQFGTVKQRSVIGDRQRKTRGVERGGVSQSPDRHGMSRDPGRIGEFLRGLVPASLARWALTISVSVERRRLPAGARLPFTVELRNRLPVPVAVPTPTHQLWTWSVGDYREGTDEPRYHTGEGTLTLRGGEQRRIEQEWNGLFGRTRDGRTRWVDPEPGEYEFAVWVATHPPCARDSVTLTLE